MYCKHCGHEMANDEVICSNCGGSASSANQTDNTNKKSVERCLPSFILGLMGSIFGLMGGICTTMCSFGSSSNSAFVLIFGGSLLGLIGACQCLNKAKIGSILETIAAAMIIYRAYFKGGSDLMTVVALLLLLAGGLIGLVCSYVIKRK